MAYGFSPILSYVKSTLKETIRILSRTWDFASILGTDVTGVRYECTSAGITIADSMWCERGFTARLQQSGEVWEYSFTMAEPTSARELADRINEKVHELVMCTRGTGRKKYPAIKDIPLKGSWVIPPAVNPFETASETIIERLEALRKQVGTAVPSIVNSTTLYEWIAYSKLFLSPERDLEQAYCISQGYVNAYARKGERTIRNYKSFSGRKGVELLDEMKDSAEEVARTADLLLDSRPVKPGVYDIICSPDVSGTIAHESFGHGVETDMFVKGRAKAAEYLGKRVAAPGTELHDGAAGVTEAASFAFDDEGHPAGNTTVIHDGIFVSGISDELSALQLGIPPTGNGRRQAFDHKAYARMTNTYFLSGKDTLESMISSVSYGFLLDRMTSGMEDPKNWGIQLITLIGREIRDGKLTGKLVSPVFISGYVPDVLGSISMVSGDFKLIGTGYCGKGYKEFVKVSSGGPWMKMKARLG